MNRSSTIEEEDAYQTKLKQKLQSNQSVIAAFSENEKNYRTHLQVAQFSKIDMKQIPAIMCDRNEELNSNIIFVFGNLIPDASFKKEFDQFRHYFLRTFDEAIDRSYYITFFNTNLMTGGKLADFQNFFLTLPLKYFQFLKNFFILHANFIVKSGYFFSSGEVAKLLKMRTEFVDSLNDLSKRKWFEVSHLEKMPDYIKQSDTTFKDILKRQKNLLIKQQRKGANIPNIDDDDDDNFNKESKILGQCFARYQYNTHGTFIDIYKISGIPLILDIMIQYFVQNAQYMLFEGIFRKQASVYEERLLEAAIANRRVRYVQKLEDPNIVAGLIKQFFMQLPEPLFPFKIYDFIIQQTQGKLPSACVQFLEQIIQTLPQVNQQVLAFMIGFFQKIIVYEESNKMTSYNMAVVFAPSFFRPEKQSMNDLLYAGFFVNLLDCLIKNYNEVFKQHNFMTCLTSLVDQKRSSLITYFPQDTANINDIDDMVPDKTGFDYLDKQMIDENQDQQMQMEESKDQQYPEQQSGQESQKSKDSKRSSSPCSNEKQFNQSEDEMYF